MKKDYFETPVNKKMAEDSLLDRPTVSFLNRLDVTDVMSRDVVTVSSNETVVAAARIMAEKDISCLMVVDGENDSPERIQYAEGGIRKYDVQTGEADAWLPGVTEEAAEPMFIPARESGGAEDEGYIASYIYNKNSDTSAFCLFDATNISAGPIAKVQLPVRVPVGFHGVWVPDSAMS